MIDLAAVGLGFLGGAALGAVTGLPLGIVNVAVVTTAAAEGPRPATRLGAGGATADAVHALAAFVGLAPALLARPRLVSVAGVIAGAACLLMAAHLAFRRRPTVRAPNRPGGFWLGVGLTLPNPAALSAWLAVAAAVGPVAIPTAAAIAVGVGLGSAAYFAALARLAARAQRPPPAAVLDRVAAVALAGLGAVALVRALA